MTDTNKFSFFAYFFSDNLQPLILQGLQFAICFYLATKYEEYKNKIK